MLTHNGFPFCLGLDAASGSRTFLDLDIVVSSVGFDQKVINNHGSVCSGSRWFPPLLVPRDLIYNHCLLWFLQVGWSKWRRLAEWLSAELPVGMPWLRGLLRK
ncbi:MAG: hypothetical protein H6Q00_3029 [Holophagaceae bacterium]|nr:hypothetical protein [Holophagaceae bacterium]